MISELLVKLKHLDKPTFDEIGMFQIHSYHAPRNQLLDNIQGCIQRAIANRGWYWGFSVGGRYTAIISKDLINFIKREASSPAEALLLAYVKILEEQHD
jgi:hypothetical protein